MIDEKLLLTAEEIRFAERCLEKAIEYGAQKARASVAKSVSDEFKTLNGELDSVTHCLDRGLSLNVFVDGRYGTFTTNRLDAALAMNWGFATMNMLPSRPSSERKRLWNPPSSMNMKTNL